ncbi:D-alanyl-D-alanine carboxypeptidase [Streptomyces roseifaciens]|uniref:D-alanyl-D-alanine carboxypeptidase n=1 Tax=Streptomyces roseifaciens TaxID=1488406 RepID=UPI001FE132BC|nr:D-alanyl-D-alanine carboxypeptidase [Streptomyces roseifaciens]
MSPASGEADADAKAETSAEDSAKAGPSTGGRAAPGGDARLKAAVAAWVAGTDGEEAEEGSEASDGSEKASKAPAAPAAADEPGEPDANSAPSGKDEDSAPADRATAVFRTVRPKADASSDDGDGNGDGDGKAAKAASGEDKDATPAGRPANGAPSAKGKTSAPADQATAVFGAVRPKADASSAEAPAAERSANGGAPSGKDKGKDSAPAPADQATAVFRTVRPKGDGPSAGGDGKASEAAKGASGERKDASSAEAPAAGRSANGAPSAKDKGEDSAPADQATAVFRTLRPKAEAPARDGEDPKSPAADGKSRGSDDQATALLKAPVIDAPARKDGAAKDGAAKKDGAAEGGDSDSERTSQFVPLKSLDEAAAKSATPAKAPAKAPARDAAKAPAKPAPAKDAAKASAKVPAPAPAPGKPAIPVSVTPPAPSERTQQQPFPPRPGGGGPTVPPAAGQPAAPLDLLAQLTNTPPPPETPTRTILRRVKIWTPLVVLLAIIFCVVQAFRPLPEPTLVLTAKKTFKFDGDKAQMTWPATGQAYVEVDGLGALGESGEEKPVPIASVTKVMTAYITLRDHPMKKGDKKGALMTVDAKAVSDYQKGKPEGESLVRVTEGQKLSEYEALEALMLPSANNIAKLLARWDAGSEEAFVKKMNDTAKDLGMVNTTFTDPSGFDATTKSTAKDLVKLGKKAMADPVFKEISGLTEYIDSNGEKQKNFNPIVPLYGTGIKTGTTTAAGGNLLFAAEKKIGGTTQLIIGAVLAQHKTPIIDSVVAATKDAIESAKKALEAKTVVKKGDVVGAVDDGLGGRTPVVATKDVTAVGWAGLSVGLALNDGGHKLPHAAKSGAEVGMLTVGSGPGQVRVPVALKAPLAEPGFGAKLTRLG